MNHLPTLIFRNDRNLFLVKLPDLDSFGIPEGSLLYCFFYSISYICQKTLLR